MFIIWLIKPIDGCVGVIVCYDVMYSVTEMIVIQYYVDDTGL